MGTRTWDHQYNWNDMRIHMQYEWHSVANGPNIGWIRTTINLDSENFFHLGLFRLGWLCIIMRMWTFRKKLIGKKSKMNLPNSSLLFTALLLNLRKLISSSSIYSDGQSPQFFLLNWVMNLSDLLHSSEQLRAILVSRVTFFPPPIYVLNFPVFYLLRFDVWFCFVHRKCSIYGLWICTEWKIKQI